MIRYILKEIGRSPMIIIKSFILVFLVSFNLNATETEFTTLLQSYEETLENLEKANEIVDLEFNILCQKDYGVKDNLLTKGDHVNLLKFYNDDKAKDDSITYFKLGDVEAGKEFSAGVILGIVGAFTLPVVMLPAAATAVTAVALKEIAKKHPERFYTVYGMPLYIIENADEVTTYIRNASSESGRKERVREIIDIIRQVRLDAAYNLAVRSCVKKTDDSKRFCWQKGRLRAKNSWLNTINIKKDKEMYLTFKTTEEDNVTRHNEKEKIPIDIKLKMVASSGFDRHNTKKVPKWYESNNEGTNRHNHFPTRFISFSDRKVQVEGELEPVSKTLKELYEGGFCDKIVGFPEEERYLHIEDVACSGTGNNKERCSARNGKTIEVGILEASKAFKGLGGEGNDRRLRKYYRSSIDLLGEVGRLEEKCQKTCDTRYSLQTSAKTSLEELLAQLQEICQIKGKVFSYKPGENGESDCYFECDEALFPNDDIAYYKCLCDYYNSGEEGIFWDGTTNTCGTCKSSKPNYHACLCKQVGGTFKENGDPQCSFDGGSGNDEDGEDSDLDSQEYVEDLDLENAAPSPSGESSDASSSSSGNDDVSGGSAGSAGSAGSDNSSSSADAGDDKKGKGKSKSSNKYAKSKGSKGLKGFDSYKGGVNNKKNKSGLKSASSGKDSEILPKNADIFNIAELTNCTACGKGNLMTCSKVKNASKQCETIISGGSGFKGSKVK